MKKSLNIVIVVVMFLVGFISGPVLRSRADGGDASLIHACVKERGGDVKIVGANNPCPGGYSPLHWGIVGPQGPQGLQGPPGPASLPAAYYQTIEPDFTMVFTRVPNFTSIGTFELPAGRWALFVEINIWLSANVIDSAVSCRIPEVSGMAVTYSPGIDAGTSIHENRVNLQMQSLSNSSIDLQTLTLQCTMSGDFTGIVFQTQGASLMAIQVAP